MVQPKSAGGAAVVPALGPPPPMPQLSTAEGTLGSGLRVIAVRRPGVPLVETQLRIPLGGAAPSHSARARLLGATLLSGTAHRGQAELAEALQELGASLTVSVDPDRLLVAGTVLCDRLPGLLKLLMEILTSARYPVPEVARERARLLEELAIERSRPEVQARAALLRRMFDRHPYARALPEPDAVSTVTAADLRRLHAKRLVPTGSALVLVGDLAPEDVLERVEADLGGWRSVGKPCHARPLPPVKPGPTLLFHRPRSVQTSIRVGGVALRRTDPEYPALHLANLVFGGYFCSRLVESLLEGKGYAYAALSRIDHGAAGSIVVVHADVATAMTAPTLVEVSYELGRVATVPVARSELDAARRYALGALARSVATQASLAASLSQLAGVGLGPDWLREHASRLGRVTVADVADVAERVFAPSRMVTAVVGDAAAVEPSLATLGAVVSRWS